MASTRIAVTAKESNSDRLKQLALPNCHLVEAVLKEHYHVFDENCRDRLKKLLELILTVNSSGRSRHDKLNVNIRSRCISNLKRRIQSLENAEKKKDEWSYKKKQIVEICNQAGDHITRDESKEMRVLFKACALKQTGNIDIVTPEPAEYGDCHSDNEHESIKTPIDFDKVSGDCRLTGEVDKLFAEYNLNIQNKPSTRCSRQDVKTTKEDVRFRETFQEKKRLLTDEIKQCRRVYFEAKQPNKTGGDSKKSQERKKEKDMTMLVVKFYLALMMDMQRNCKIYENFASELIKPTESYKQPYLEAAYTCWMEYMSYVKYTLDYLQPYVMSMVNLYKTYYSGHPKLAEYEKKLPKVLVNSIKNMKPWRRALSETVECCKDLVEDKGKNSVAFNVHQMYLRYHQKIRTLKQNTLQIK